MFSGFRLAWTKIVPTILLSPLFIFLGSAVCGEEDGSSHRSIETSWGSLLWGGSYAGTLIIERPKDLQIVLPRELPQVISAETLCQQHASAYLPILLGKDSDDVAIDVPNECQVSFRVSDTTKQTPFGEIFFTAKDAKVHGTTAKLEENPGNYRIGFWTNADDYITWDYKATRWGKYRVLLTYSTAAPDGSEIEVEFGGAKVAGKLKSTGSWYTYHTIDLGELYLAKDGPQTLTVRCKKKVGPAVMNLKAVILEPTCEGEEPTQAEDGTILLHGRDATVNGVKLCYEPAEKKQTLGYWTNPEDAARWDFQVTNGGEFDIEVLQGCGKGQGGSEVQISTTDDQQLSFIVEDTGHFQNFKPRVVGRVKFEAGRRWLVVQPKKIAKAAACDIRQIRLIPVNENK